MFIDKINLNHLRIFECVYRTRSMTLASRELHLTQSGVSQHIKTLEDVLHIRLFDRIKQRLVPTAEAGILFQKCAESFQGIELALAQIQGGEKSLTGTVSIGMPIEFGNNVIVPLLTRFARENPRVKFQLRLGFASEMNDLLLSGDLDFAFIDSFRVDRRITTESVYDEVLELCIAADQLRNVPVGKKALGKEDRKFFESLDYVEYQRGEPILRMWFAHHLSTQHLNLNVRATVMDVQGVARFIQTGLGAGVLPSYLLAKLKREGIDLHRFKGCGKPLKNAISIAYLRERTQQPAAIELQTFLKAALKKDMKSGGGAMIGAVPEASA